MFLFELLYFFKFIENFNQYSESNAEQQIAMDVSINTTSISNNTDIINSGSDKLINSGSDTDKIDNTVENSEKPLSPSSLKRSLEDAENNKENYKKKIKTSEDYVAKKNL